MFFLFVLMVMAGGCSPTAVLARDDGDGGSRNDGSSSGTNAGTLVVHAEIEVSNTEDNAQQPQQFETRFLVTVSRNAQTVSDAVVSVEAGGRTVPLMFVSGSYQGRQEGYAMNYTFRVRAGREDLVSTITGPAVHSFLSPLSGTRVRAGQPLEVRWSPAGAMQATLETRQLAEMSIPDTGSFTIPMLTGQPGQVREDQVRVRRRTMAPFLGAAEGSLVRVEVRNEVDFMIDGT